jgi:hypothetical protein
VVEPGGGFADFLGWFLFHFYSLSARRMVIRCAE